MTGNRLKRCRRMKFLFEVLWKWLSLMRQFTAWPEHIYMTNGSKQNTLLLSYWTNQYRTMCVAVIHMPANLHLSVFLQLKACWIRQYAVVQSMVFVHHIPQEAKKHQLQSPEESFLVVELAVAKPKIEKFIAHFWQTISKNTPSPKVSIHHRTQQTILVQKTKTSSKSNPGKKRVTATRSMKPYHKNTEHQFYNLLPSTEIKRKTRRKTHIHPNLKNEDLPQILVLAPFQLHSKGHHTGTFTLNLSFHIPIQNKINIKHYLSKYEKKCSKCKKAKTNSNHWNEKQR